MSRKVRKHSSEKDIIRQRRRRKIRSTLEGTAERPRLCVFRSNTHLYAQVIDDVAKKTIASVSTSEEEFRGKVKKNIEGAKTIGSMIAKRALAKKVANVVFDRSGYLYHGKIKALAEGAREGGLKF